MNSQNSGRSEAFASSQTLGSDGKFAVIEMMKGLKPESGASASMKKEISRILSNVNNDMSKDGNVGKVSSEVLDDLAMVHFNYQMDMQRRLGLIDSEKFDLLESIIKDALKPKPESKSEPESEPELTSNTIQHSIGSKTGTNRVIKPGAVFQVGDRVIITSKNKYNGCEAEILKQNQKDPNKYNIQILNGPKLKANVSSLLGLTD